MFHSSTRPFVSLVFVTAVTCSQFSLIISFWLFYCWIYFLWPNLVVLFRQILLPNSCYFSTVPRKRWSGGSWVETRLENFLPLFKLTRPWLTRAVCSSMKGRVDDNIETIRKRFKVFQESSMQVVEYYDSRGKVRKVCGCSRTIP